MRDGISEIRPYFLLNFLGDYVFIGFDRSGYNSVSFFYHLDCDAEIWFQELTATGWQDAPAEYVIGDAGNMTAGTYKMGYVGYSKVVNVIVRNKEIGKDLFMYIVLGNPTSAPVE